MADAAHGGTPRRQNRSSPTPPLNGYWLAALALLGVLGIASGLLVLNLGLFMPLHGDSNKAGQTLVEAGLACMATAGAPAAPDALAKVKDLFR